MREVKRLPIATLALILINLCAAFWAALNADDSVSWGFDPAHPAAGAAVISLFVHLNLLHVAGNLVFLAAVGPAVEFAAGAMRFLTVYLLGGIAGVLLHWALNLHAANPSILVGASGCIAACAAFYSIRFFNLRVPLAPGFGVPLWGVFLLWAALQAAGGLTRIGQEQGGVSFWAHLGGLGAGAALSLFYRAPKLAAVHFGHDVLDRMNHRGPAAVAEAARLHLQEHPGDERAMWELAESQRQLGDEQDEIETLLSIVKANLPKRGDAALRLSELGALPKMTAINRYRLAESLRLVQPEAARTVMESVANGPEDDDQTPEAIFTLAEWERDFSLEASTARLKVLTDRYPLHPTVERARAKGWLG